MARSIQRNKPLYYLDFASYCYCFGYFFFLKYVLYNLVTKHLNLAEDKQDIWL